MIPFLIKLANLLDKQGKYKLSAEVDDLIEKLAQVMPPTTEKDLEKSDQEFEGNVGKMLDSQESQKAPNAAPTPAPVKKQPSKETMDTIRLIQDAVGVVDVDGKWGPDTNKKFIAYMNTNFPVAMKNNVFIGPVIDNKGTHGGNKLSDAWELIKEKNASQQELSQEPPQKDMASKAPSQRPVKLVPDWHSKYFQITPNTMNSLREIEKKWPGTAQFEINRLDQQKETGTAGKHMDQGIFEEMLAGRSKPA